MMTADTAFTPREMLSLMMDGQASAAQTAVVVQACQDDPELMQAWASYHAVGDALRNPWRDARLSSSRRDARSLDLTVQGQMPAGSAADLVRPTTLAHVQPEVAVSSTVSAATATTAATTAAQASPGAAQVSPIAQTNPALQFAQPEAANDAVFRWKMLAGVAAFAAVSSLVWSLVGGTMGSDTAGQLAAATQPSVTAQPATVLASNGNGQVMIRDPRLDAMLAAHKQFGGASALQQPAGFLRSATFQAADR
jgi:sigma-E factor negative regulatory protein RseA